MPIREANSNLSMASPSQQGSVKEKAHSLENMKSHKLFGDYNPFKEKEEQDTLRGNRHTSHQARVFNANIDNRQNEMNSIRMRSMMGEVGKTLIHPSTNQPTEPKPSWAKNSLSVGSSINPNQYQS